MAVCDYWPTKVRYRSEARARSSLARLIHHGQGQCRIYHCQHCDGWHTTTQAIRRRTGENTPIPAGLIPMLTLPGHEDTHRIDFFPWHREAA